MRESIDKVDHLRAHLKESASNLTLPITHGTWHVFIFVHYALSHHFCLLKGGKSVLVAVVNVVHLSLINEAFDALIDLFLL